MGRLATYISTMMLALLLWSGTAAHAVEAAEAASCDSSVSASVDQGDHDRGSKSGEADHSAIHHHGGCHGHCSAVGNGVTARSTDLGKGLPATWDHSAFDSGTGPDQDIRPPIA